MVHCLSEAQNEYWHSTRHVTQVHNKLGHDMGRTLEQITILLTNGLDLYVSAIHKKIPKLRHAHSALTPSLVLSVSLYISVLSTSLYNTLPFCRNQTNNSAHKQSPYLKKKKSITRVWCQTGQNILILSHFSGKKPQDSIRDKLSSGVATF